MMCCKLKKSGFRDNMATLGILRIFRVLSKYKISEKDRFVICKGVKIKLFLAEFAEKQIMTVTLLAKY